jgi:hypothetical protein
MTVNFVYMTEFIGPTWRGFTGSFTLVLVVWVWCEKQR